MYEQLNVEDRQKITPVGRPEITRTLLLELMRQNAMVLEANCRAMKLISSPLVFIGDQPETS